MSSTTTAFASVALALVTVFIIDPLDPSTLSTPFCLGIIMMVLSFHQRPGLVFGLSLIFCVLVVYAMIHFIEGLHTTTPHPIFWFFQRFGMFVLVCVLAVYLSYYRAGAERNLAQIQEVLSKLPVPVIISDAAGYITYVNEALCLLCRLPTNALVGQRYIDIFMKQTHEGKATRYYMELFEDPSNPVHRVELSAATGSITSATCLGTGTGRKMITVLQQTAAVPEVIPH